MSYDDSHLRRSAREALEKGETERQGPRLWVILSGAIAAALIAFAALVIVRGLDINGGDGGDAPLITAEAGPGKVRPEDSGGLEVSDQDKFVYDRIASNEAPEELEQLLPGRWLRRWLPSSVATARSAISTPPWSKSTRWRSPVRARWWHSTQR